MELGGEKMHLWRDMVVMAKSRQLEVTFFLMTLTHKLCVRQ